MGKFRDYLEKIKRVTESAQTEALLKICDTHKAQMVDLNIAQLYSGKNADGNELGRYRDEGYAAFKNRENPSAGLGIWDLHLTGDLYRGMNANTSEFPITIDSTDSKAAKFRDANPFGLDEESKEKFRQECRPDIESYYSSVFRL